MTIGRGSSSMSIRHYSVKLEPTHVQSWLPNNQDFGRYKASRTRSTTLGSRKQTGNVFARSQRKAHMSDRLSGTYETERNRLGPQSERRDLGVEGERGASGRQLSGADGKVQDHGDTLIAKRLSAQRTYVERQNQGSRHSPNPPTCFWRIRGSPNR
jgi:hypothetical protein